MVGHQLRMAGVVGMKTGHVCRSTERADNSPPAPTDAAAAAAASDNQRNSVALYRGMN